MKGLYLTTAVVLFALMSFVWHQPFMASLSVALLGPVIVVVMAAVFFGDWLFNR